MKEAVASFWNEASCGEALLLHGDEQSHYAAQSEGRYLLEPHISSFARFDEARGLDVLELGVGLGADHQRFAESGAILSGVDLTERAIEHTARRLSLVGLSSNLVQGDVEALPFQDNSFDVVYSWGVIHHSPNTGRAAAEIFRVLRPGGRYAVMIYSRWSFVGLMLWMRYGLPKFRGLTSTYSEYMESPGTQAFSRAQASKMFPGASITTALSSGDLLIEGTGQRHKGRILDLVRRIWPRSLISCFPRFGLFILIEGYNGVDTRKTVD